jgi:hypothetical protein
LLCQLIAGEAGKETSFEAPGVVKVEYVVRVRLGPPTQSHGPRSAKSGAEAVSAQPASSGDKEQEAAEEAVEEVDRDEDGAAAMPHGAGDPIQQEFDWSTAPTFIFEHPVQITTDIWGTRERELASLGGEPVPALGIWAGGSAHPIGY